MVYWSGCLSACLICQNYMPVCQNTLPQLGSAMLLHLTFLESNQEPIAHRQEMLFSQGVPLVLIGLIVWMNNHRGMWARGSKSGRWIASLQAKWRAWISKCHCCPSHHSLPCEPPCYRVLQISLWQLDWLSIISDSISFIQHRSSLNYYGLLFKCIFKFL